MKQQRRGSILDSPYAIGATASLILGLGAWGFVALLVVFSVYAELRAASSTFYLLLYSASISAFVSIISGHVSQILGRSTLDKAHRSKARIGLSLGYIWICIAGVVLFLLNRPTNLMRVRVTIANAELSVIAKSLESYFVDNQTYPPAMDAEGNLVEFDSDGRSVGFVPWLLCVPVRHISHLPKDYYSQKWYMRKKDRKGYRYAARSDRWIVASAGPDMKFQSDLGKIIGSASGEIDNDLLRSLQYDPTNGIKSEGDIIYEAPR